MNRILVPIDFTPDSANALRYAHELALLENTSLSLFHCYPFHKHNRKYDFGTERYDSGIKRKLIEFYKKNIPEGMEKTRFLPRMGTLIDKVIHISAGYRKIVMSGNEYKSTYDRWAGSKTSAIAANARCPVLIIPPTAILKEQGWNNVWHFQRQENEQKVINFWMKKKKLDFVKVNVKSLKQTSFTSLLWESISKYVKAPKKEIHEVIKAAQAEENIDLILLVSHGNDSFKKFIDDEAMQIIFDFGIPVLVFQEQLS